ncbi:alpha/beta fold hydrolase [Marinobacterium aestuariivivens]|uniref:Alpha/beta fold hydrolase n=1 Tax=Marinobacterium aestuariivivens TaxID=1698799 RepID=A0ABW2A7V1_9GAMM
MKSLLLLPGLLCDDAVWRDQVASLGDWRCLVPDYGLADSIEDMAARALDKAPERFVLAGHSMGGRVALEIYRQAPERVCQLILLDTGYAGRPAGDAGEHEKAAGWRCCSRPGRPACAPWAGPGWRAWCIRPASTTRSSSTTSWR